MSPARLRIHPVARAEIRTAQRYYAGQRTGLGRALLAEVDAVLALAHAHPELYEAFTPGEPAVRRAVLHRFPYALVYEILASGSPRVLASTCAGSTRREYPPGWTRRR